MGRVVEAVPSPVPHTPRLTAKQDHNISVIVGSNKREELMDPLLFLAPLIIVGFVSVAILISGWTGHT